MNYSENEYSKFFLDVNNYTQALRKQTKQGKAIPVQTWAGPEVSRSLTLQEFKTIGISGKVACTTHRPHFPQKTSLVLIYFRGLVDPRAIVRPEELGQ